MSFDFLRFLRRDSPHAPGRKIARPVVKRQSTEAIQQRHHAAAARTKVARIKAQKRRKASK